jgi:aspartate/methionine/tyrosine aminotransferase
MRNRKNLTQYEHDALNNVYNLADGHAHQLQSPDQEYIIAHLSDIFHLAELNSQKDSEKKFQIAFWDVAKQSRALAVGTSLYCYSASTAIEIVANFLRKRALRTALIEPTFDNLPSILRRVGVDVVALREEDLFPVPRLEHIARLDVGAIFIVLPNNPTGKLIDRSAFSELARFCADTNKILIVDFSFRFFAEAMYWDQYGLMIDLDCDFLFIEDTGKTWPSLDLKISLLTPSRRLYDETYIIHNDFLLNVSPFILLLLCQYIESTKNLGIEHVVTNIVRKNRDYLRTTLAGTYLKPVNLDSSISVEWLEIISVYSGENIWQRLSAKGVYVLPGSNFYWNSPNAGTSYLRVTLMRDPLMFRAAADRFVSVLSTSL